MKPLRVNVDYEMELFGGGPGPQGMNESLEFLAFFLEPRPILTRKVYSEEYLDYVAKVAGQRPVFVREGTFENWWGKLQDLPKERWLNSKITSTEFALEKGWLKDAFIVKGKGEVPLLKSGVQYLLKDPFTMSGRGFTLITRWEETFFKNRPLIVEPYLNRRHDFSHYVFPDGKTVVYENLVDKKFQFKGSVFRNTGRNLQDLPFYHEVPSGDWEDFGEAFLLMKEYFKNGFGFSVDSFLYEKDGKLALHYLSEVNARRTMGRVTYEIGERYTPQKGWWALVIGKSMKEKGGFSFLRERLSVFEDVLILSPGDARFEVLFLAASDEWEGKELLRRVSEEVPEAHFGH